MDNYFSDCGTLEEAKKVYRKESLNLHPDQGGNAEDFKSMKKEYEMFISTFMYRQFTEAGDKTGNHTFHVFDHIIKAIYDFDMDIEIIGFWIYAKNSFAYKDQLKELGFWFSGKHKAWVFSGTEKKKRNSRLSVDDVKNLHGCESVKSKSEHRKIA